MARIKSTNFYQKSGKVANEVFSNLGNGEVGCRAKNSKQAPLNEEQKINASGFSALNAEVRYLNPVLHVTFPRDTNGVKWANRFTSVNKKREGVLTTTKIHPDSPVDPKKKANEEYTSEIDWTKVLFVAHSFRDRQQGQLEPRADHRRENEAPFPLRVPRQRGDSRRGRRGGRDV